MAAPAGTYTSYENIGTREDLADIIYEITPVDTPFLSNVGRGTATQTKTEWQTQALRANALNSQIEGDDPSAQTATPTSRLANYQMISWKVPQVTGTQRAQNSAGRGDELSYQISIAGRELKRDLETGLLGLQAGTAGVAASARVLAGVASWLWTNQSTTGDATANTTPVVTSGVPTTAPTAGTAAAASVGNLKGVVASCWDAGGDPTVILMGSSNKQLMSGFDGVATLYRDSQGRQPATMIGAVDTWVSDFGQHQLVADRFMPATNVYALDMEFWSVDYLRPIQQEALAKTGDSDKRMILCEHTLCAKQPDASGKIYTTT